MSFGTQTFTPSGGILFDSTVEHVLFNSYEQGIQGSSVPTGGLSISYPGLVGKKISASLISPYQVGSIDGWAVLSCRVTYPSNVPTVLVFVDNTKATLPKCDGYLTVFDTGAKL